MAEEVVAVHERCHRAIGKGHLHDAVRRLLVVEPMVLQHREDAPASRIDAQVGEAHPGLARQRPRCRTRIDAHQVTIRELAVDDEAVEHGPGPTAVLVDARAHVRWSRRELRDGAVRVDPQQHRPTAFLGPTLEQVDSPTVDPWLREPVASGQDQVKGDGRWP